MSEKPDECENDACPGPEGWEVGFGLAGGGYGPYTYCPVCGNVIDKANELETDDG